ncbi:MAG TPA: ribosome-binding factor A, partial [Oscillibacter sp.]|nr:ribosome-binding factor A [Oscillibacter sp.]
KSAAGYLRRELGANMSLRYTPELQFIADDSIEYGAHILEMLRDPRVVKPANPENETLNTEDEQE